MSGDMLTFHEAISKLQEAEEDMVDYHKLVIESNSRWMQQDKYLLDMTNQVEYDQEGMSVSCVYSKLLFSVCRLYNHNPCVVLRLISLLSGPFQLTPFNWMS